MFIATILHAQNQSATHRIKVVNGIIVDGTTSQSVPNAYISTSRFGAVSDNNGNFSIALSYGDSLHFSHVSYLASQAIFNKELDHDKWVIVLRPKITFLKEITVTGLPTETEFRNQVLETTPEQSVEEEIAQDNVRILGQAAKFAMPLPMDSYESYRDYIKGPQGVVIFSSNGSKGLVRAIKNVIRSSRYKFTSTFKSLNNSLRNTAKARIDSPTR